MSTVIELISILLLLTEAAVAPVALVLTPGAAVITSCVIYEARMLA